MGKEVKNEAKVKKAKKVEVTAKEQTKKVEKKEKAELEVVNEVIIKKTLKYKYPKGLLEPQKRKSYRQKARNILEKAELRVIHAKGSEEVKKAKEALAELKSQYLSE